jgi:HPt (histidine-containing phosphotransfer) domain-containing protein
MAFDPGAISSTLAAAVGDEPALVAELRQAFAESVARAVDTLDAAPDPSAWSAAAARLKGLAASFGAVRLMALADQAIAGGARDAALVRKIRRTADRI